MDIIGSGVNEYSKIKDHRTSGTARIYPESEGSLMTRFTRVALRGSRGASTMPLTKPFSGAPHKLLMGFNGDHHQAV